MTTERPIAAPVEQPNFNSMATDLAKELGETDPLAQENLKAVLEWMHDPAKAEKKPILKAKKSQIRSYVESLKINPEKKEKLEKIITGTADPALKTALKELLAHVAGTKDTLKEEPQSGFPGIPVEFPEAKPADSDSKTSATDKKVDQPQPPDAKTPAEKKDTSKKEGDKKPDQKKEAANKEAKEKEAKAKAKIDEMNKFLGDVDKMDSASLLSELAKMLGQIKDWFSKLMEGGAAGTPEKAGYGEDVAKKVKPDFPKAEQMTFKSNNRDVEYVANVLNLLPPKENAEAFLQALKGTKGCVFDTTKDPTKLKVGDVLFFNSGKPQEKEKAALTAIVSDIKPPPKMKLVQGSEKPREVEIAKSPLFMNKWLGFVRLPEDKAAEAAKPDSGATTPAPAPKQDTKKTPGESKAVASTPGGAPSKSTDAAPKSDSTGSADQKAKDVPKAP